MHVAWKFDEYGDLAGDGPGVAFHTARTVAAPLAGGVEVEERRSCIVIEIDGRTVTPQALTGVYIWLHHVPPKPCIIRDIAGLSRAQIYFSYRGALDHMSQLIEQRRERPRFERWQVLLERSCFARTVAAAQAVLQSDIAEPARHGILDALFKGRFALHVYDDQSRSCAVLRFGSQIDLTYDVADVRNYRDLEDHRYGRWIADTFDGYYGLTTPQAETIHAEVDLARVKGRICYTRLVLPYVAGARRRLLVASELH